MSWNVTVSRTEVLETIKRNREDHKRIVVEAWDGFRAAVIEEMERRLELIRQGKSNDTYIRLPQPEDHTDEYDTIIGMLEMSKEETVSLGPTEYRSYVEDKWDWKDRWITTNSSYTVL